MEQSSFWEAKNC